MIVRDRPSGLRLFLLLRGSILQRIRWTLLFNTLLATAVTLAHGNLFTFKITLTPIPFTLMGLPLAIFLGFRNTTAYDRYWEGRKLWGELVLRTRNLSRQCLSLIELDQPVDPANRAGDVRVRMVHRAIAFVHALRLHLRSQSDDALLQRWLPAQDWPRVAQFSVRPEAIMQGLGQDLRQCLREGRIDPCLAAGIDTTLSAMTASAASCERIRNTPVPFSYTLLLHRTAYLYCFLLDHAGTGEISRQRTIHPRADLDAQRTGRPHQPARHVQLFALQRTSTVGACHHKSLLPRAPSPFW